MYLQVAPHLIVKAVILRIKFRVQRGAEKKDRDTWNAGKMSWSC